MKQGYFQDWSTETLSQHLPTMMECALAATAPTASNHEVSSMLV